jgi:hypothetical protein
MNQLINDEAVCRTAPATPGLSKKWGFVKGRFLQRTRVTTGRDGCIYRT